MCYRLQTQTFSPTKHHLSWALRWAAIIHLSFYSFILISISSSSSICYFFLPLTPFIFFVLQLFYLFCASFLSLPFLIFKYSSFFFIVSIFYSFSLSSLISIFNYLYLKLVFCIKHFIIFYILLTFCYTRTNNFHLVLLLFKFNEYTFIWLKQILFIFV